jgi:ABC-type Fe3+ transport system substrate-binding protein
MPLSRIGIFLALVLILGVPFLMRPQRTAAGGPVEATLVVMTPHVPQIRAEFAAAFDRWHRRTHGTGVAIDWRVPGGTSDIMAQLQAVYSSEGRRLLAELAQREPERLSDPALNLDGLIQPRTMTIDLFFGGGSYDHGRVKNPRTAAVWVNAFPGGGVEEVELGPLAKGEDPGQFITQVMDPKTSEVTLPAQARGRALTLRVPLGALSGGREVLQEFAKSATVRARVDLSRVQREVPLSMSEPAGFSQSQLDAWYGENAVGAQQLYDPQQQWLGLALSGFGIVYNKDLLAEMGVPEPTRFDDLADPRLRGMVMLADPRQSGSVATTLDSILSNYGWDRGWRLIRELCANARTFTNSAPKPPIDVSQGEAAMALAIDFYGRGQSQAVLAPGQEASESRVGYVDPAGATYIDADPISILRGGPHPELSRRFVEFCLTEEGQALWQLPARTRAENPVAASGEELGPQQYELRRMPARRVMYEKYREHFIDKADPFEIASQVKPAGWRDGLGIMMGAFAIDNSHVQRDAWAALIRARSDASFPPDRLAEMERLFYAFPTTTLPDGRVLEFTPETLRPIAAAWRRDARFKSRCEIEYTRFYRECYQRVSALARGGEN